MVARHATRSPWRARLTLAGVVVVLGAGVVSIGVGGRVTPTPTTSLAPVTSSSAPLRVTTTTRATPSVTIAAVGDTFIGSANSTLASNPLALFSPVESLLHADIVFGNLEGTLTSATSSKCGVIATNCYAFKAPPAYAKVYARAGFRVLNSANNHSYDYLSAGETSTSAALAAAGIVQAGLPGQIGVVTAHGVKVAFCDFAPYGLTNNLLNFPAAAALIARAHQLAPLVVVYMHAGAEGASADHVTRHEEYFVGEDRGNPYAFAHYAVDHGADLVIASGPHVLRGMEYYRGRLIAYSLGDFTNFDDFSAQGDLALSGVLHVTFTRSARLMNAHFDSVLLSSTGVAAPDPHHAAANFMNQLSREDFGSSAALVGAGGLIGPASG